MPIDLSQLRDINDSAIYCSNSAKNLRESEKQWMNIHSKDIHLHHNHGMDKSDEERIHEEKDQNDVDGFVSIQATQLKRLAAESFPTFAIHMKKLFKGNVVTSLKEDNLRIT